MGERKRGEMTETIELMKDNGMQIQADGSRDVRRDRKDGQKVRHADWKKGRQTNKRRMLKVHYE